MYNYILIIFGVLKKQKMLKSTLIISKLKNLYEELFNAHKILNSAHKILNNAQT